MSVFITRTSSIFDGILFVLHLNWFMHRQTALSINEEYGNDKKYIDLNIHYYYVDELDVTRQFSNWQMQMNNSNSLCTAQKTFF